MIGMGALGMTFAYQAMAEKEAKARQRAAMNFCSRESRMLPNQNGRHVEIRAPQEQRWHRISSDVIEDLESMPRGITLSIQDSILVSKVNEIRGTDRGIRRARMVSLCALLVDTIEQLDLEEDTLGPGEADHCANSAPDACAISRGGEDPTTAPLSFRTLHLDSDAVIGDESIHHLEAGEQ